MDLQGCPSYGRHLTRRHKIDSILDEWNQPESKETYVDLVSVQGNQKCTGLGPALLGKDLHRYIVYLIIITKQTNH